MADDPLNRFRRDHPRHPDARVIEASTHTGRPCRIVDNTGSVEPADLAALLEDLIRERRFGYWGLATGPDAAVSLEGPVGSHIQLGGQLYRLVLFPYEARIERF